MSVEANRKAQFVNELGRLFSKYGIADITALTYREGEVYEEEVLVTYYGGGHRLINVNMDSLTAIVSDIVNQGALD